MGEYKRLISYIYSYERGAKSKNAGFAKIESRNGICKVNISLRIADELMNEAEDNMLEVFFFYRENNDVKKVFLDRIKIVNGCSLLKVRMSSDNIGGAGVDIDKITGIFVCTKNFLVGKDIMNIVYASEWDDVPIVINEFKEKESNKLLQEPFEMDYNESSIQKDNNQKDGNEIYNDNLETKEVLEPQNVNYQIQEQTMEENSDNVSEEVVQEKNEQEETEQEECSNKLVEILMEEQKKDEIEAMGPTAGDYFKMLCGCYPKIKVEEIDGECIKITPHDISYLPRKYWNLCNNSFLLHGYYNYKYLLLCEKIINAEKKYLVGVPGMFHQKEQMMAKMFGFTEFECNGSNGAMKFGYWCTYL